MKGGQQSFKRLCGLSETQSNSDWTCDQFDVVATGDMCRGGTPMVKLLGIFTSTNKHTYLLTINSHRGTRKYDWRCSWNGGFSLRASSSHGND